MKSAALFIIIIVSLINFHCGKTLNIEKNKATNEIEKTKSIATKLKPEYSGIFLTNPGVHAGIWYVNSKDSVKKLIVSLPANYGISADNFFLSPLHGFLAFYDYDSSNNRTNVYSINLNNRNLAWLKSDAGRNGVDLVWQNDSLLYCNLSSGDKDSYATEKYTALINVDKNEVIKNFKPVRGNSLVGYIDNKYLLYEFDPGCSIYRNHYYLIEKNTNRIFRDYERDDNSHGLADFTISPAGTVYFHIPSKVFTDEKSKRIKEEELVVNNLYNTSGKPVSHTQIGFKDAAWSPSGNVVSFLKVGSINYNAATQKYTDIRYLYFYNVKTKRLTNLKTYQDEGSNGVEAEFDIPKTLTNASTIFNYLYYKWSPSGKYLFINRQDLTMNGVHNKCIIFDYDSKTESTLINDYQDGINLEGWWNDDLIILLEGDKHLVYDLKNNRNVYITFNGSILFLEMHELQK